MIYSFLSLYLPILSLILLTFILVVRDRVIEKRIRRDFYFIIAFLLATFICGASFVSGAISAFPISFGTTMVRCILQPVMICFGLDIVRREEKDLFDLYTATKGALQQFESPVDYYWYNYVSSYYGYRKNPVTGANEFHRGIDIAVPDGSTVYATHAGTIAEAGYDDYYGNYVVITDSNGYTTKYGHLSTLNVSAGQTVRKGKIIGKTGNTGSSTGSHLHLECLYNGEYYNPYFYFLAGTQTMYGETTGGSGATDLDIPSSYSDAQVAALIAEAENYLGMDY